MKTAEEILTTKLSPTAIATASRTTSDSDWRSILEPWTETAKAQGIDDGLPRFGEICAKIAKKQLGNGQGLFIIGGVGCGKTHRMRFIERNLSVSMIAASEMVDRLCRNDSLSYFRELARLDFANSDNKRYNDLIVDDIGAEDPITNNFGNRRDIMSRVLSARHSAWLENGWLTHFTSNLTEQMLLERYGERIVSRLHEMCIFVVMHGGDRRRERRM